MLTRRSFLASLAALPFVGKFFQPEYPLLNIAPIVRDCKTVGFARQPDPWVPMTVTPSEGGGEIFITSGNSIYVFSDKCAIHENCRCLEFDAIAGSRKNLGVRILDA